MIEKEQGHWDLRLSESLEERDSYLMEKAQS